MKLQQGNNYNQNFGMAWSVRPGAFVKADGSELKKVKCFLDANKSKLDEATKDTLCQIGGRVSSGKITKLTVTSTTEPESFMELLGTIFKLLGDLVIPFRDKGYIQKIKIKDLSDDKFIDLVNKSTEGAKRKFGAEKIVKEYFDK